MKQHLLGESKALKVFISWSGEQSRRIAAIFHQWLPCAIHAVKPFLSLEDISKGTRWNTDVAKELEDSKIGLLILTRANLQAPWIMFEAGALSKNLDKSKVCPILFGVEHSDLQGPLVQFQASRFEKDEIKRVVKMINNELEDSLASGVLDIVFDKWWPELDQKVNNEMISLSEPTVNTPRPKGDILEEVLALVRAAAQPPEIILQELKSVAAELREIKYQTAEIKTHDNLSSDSSAQKSDYSAQTYDEETISDESKEGESASAVMDWLAAHEINIKKYSQPDMADNVLNELSNFIGERYENVARLLEKIRKNLSTGSGFSLKLSDRTLSEISDSTNLCVKLNNYAFLSTYQYNKYNRTIYATPQRRLVRKSVESN